MKYLTFKVPGSSASCSLLTWKKSRGILRKINFLKKLLSLRNSILDRLSRWQPCAAYPDDATLRSGHAELSYELYATSMAADELCKSPDRLLFNGRRHVQLTPRLLDFKLRFSFFFPPPCLASFFTQLLFWNQTFQEDAFHPAKCFDVKGF